MTDIDRTNCRGCKWSQWEQGGPGTQFEYQYAFGICIWDQLHLPPRLVGSAPLPLIPDLFYDGKTCPVKEIKND